MLDFAWLNRFRHVLIFLGTDILGLLQVLIFWRVFTVLKIWNGKLILKARRWRRKQKNKTKIYILKQIAQYLGFQTNLLQDFSFSPWRKFVFKPKYWAICLNIYIFVLFFCFNTSSSPCRKDQFAVSYFSTSIVTIQVYNWEIRHHSLVCCCGLADILYSLQYSHVN